MTSTSIPNIEERVTNSLEPVYQNIHNFILNSTLTKHFDETGWRNDGKRHYVLIVTSNEAAIYMLNRNQLAFQEKLKNKIEKEEDQLGVLQSNTIQNY